MLSAGLLRRLNCSLYVSCVHGNETKTRGAITFGGEYSMAWPAIACLQRLCCHHWQPGISVTISSTINFIALADRGRWLAHGVPVEAG